MKNQRPTTIVWFRQDLRLADNPALTAALRGGSVLPVFIWAPEEEGDWPPGAASRWWLHQSLKALDAELRRAGSRLILRRGNSSRQLLDLAAETGASTVHWNRRYEPSIIARDQAIERQLAARGIAAETHNAALLFEPWTVKNRSGNPFQVFTAYWRTCLGHPDPPEPAPAPRSLPGPAKWPKSSQLEEFELEPKLDWASGFRAVWKPGSVGALGALKVFAQTAVLDYDKNRNRPDLPGTSRLSPHLHFGEVGPRQIWHTLRRSAETKDLPPAQWRNWQYLTEIGWREFAHHLLYHFPHTANDPLRGEFQNFPWQSRGGWLKAWQKGRTGYPIVDAGMRELWATGWMHNRVRMIVASFLVKDLLISWQSGAKWFWDTLVDADLPSNTLGWQWTAGCGADAAPYFRIFNPVSQGEKFDPLGNYVRRWVPELGQLPTEWIHRPWEAPSLALTMAGVRLGRTYPRPIVSHAIAREVALEAFRGLSEKRKSG